MGNALLPGEEPEGKGMRPGSEGENSLTQRHNCCYFLTACHVPGEVHCLTVRILGPGLPPSLDRGPYVGHFPNNNSSLQKLKVVVSQSYGLCNAMDCSPSGSSVHGILQARILEWVADSFSRTSSHPGIEPRSPTLQKDSLWCEPPGKLQAQR